MKASIDFVHLSYTHPVHSYTKLKLFICYAQQPGFMNFTKKMLKLCAQDLWHYAHIRFKCDLDMGEGACDNSHINGDSIKVNTPAYQHTVSPPAASRQNHQQNQVLNGTRYLHM